MTRRDWTVHVESDADGSWKIIRSRTFQRKYLACRYRRLVIALTDHYAFITEYNA